MPRLKDKVVLVTGAAGAIGAAIASAIEAAGGTAIGSDLAGRGNGRQALDVTAEERLDAGDGCDRRERAGGSTGW